VNQIIKMDTERVVEKILAGDVRTAARLVRQIEDNPQATRTLLSALFLRGGQGHTVGITGNPGAGKSTLVSGLVTVLRKRETRVGVIAVDPSSPFSGGAILGDRIRMMEHAADPGVFIRSCASRGTLGGISSSTGDISTVMGAMGFDPVIIETVGVGQAEVDVAFLTETVVVVVTPGHGDDVQALKAGLLEIADVFVVNKADYPGAATLAAQLDGLWELGGDPDPSAWRPPVLQTVASDGTGLEALLGAIEEHRTYITENPKGKRERRRRVKARLSRLIQADYRAEVGRQLGALIDEKTVDRLIDRTLDPYSVARSTVDRLMGREKKNH
jgi:LAO/AO transport system kinase